MTPIADFLRHAALCACLALCAAAVPAPAYAQPREEAYEVFVQAGHAASIQGVAATADGRLAASVDAAGELKLWDAATRRELWRAAEMRGLPAPRFTLDGARLIAATRGGQLAAFDAATGARLWSAPLPGTPTFWDGALALDSSRAHVGLISGAVASVALADGAPAGILNAHEGAVVALAVHEGELITAGRDRRLRVFASVATKGPAATASGSATGPFMAASRWSTELPRPPRALAIDVKHGRAIVAMSTASNPREQRFFAPDLWRVNLVDGVKAGEEGGLFDAEVMSLAVSPDGQWLAVGGGNLSSSPRRRASTDNMVEMRRLTSAATRSTAAQDLRYYYNLTSDIRSVAFAGERLLIGTRDAVPRLWPYLLANEGDIDAPKVAAADIAPAPAVPTRRAIDAAAQGMRPGVAALSPNGKRFALALTSARELHEGLLTRPVRIALVDSKTRQEVASLEGHGGTVEALAWSADGRWLASAAEDDIRLWNTVTGDEIKRIERSRGAGSARPRVTVLAFSPDRARIAIGYSDGLITVYDSATLDYVARFVWMAPRHLRFEGEVLHAQGGSGDGHTYAARFALAASSVPLSGYAAMPLSIAQFDARRLVVGDATGALTEWRLDQGLRGVRQGALAAPARAADSANDFAFLAGHDPAANVITLRQRTPQGASRWLADLPRVEGVIEAGVGALVPRPEEQALAAPALAAHRTRMLTAWSYRAAPGAAAIDTSAPASPTAQTFGRIHLIDTESGRRLAAFGEGLGRIAAMAFSPNADIAYVLSLAPDEPFAPPPLLLAAGSGRHAELSAWRLPAGTPLWRHPIEWRVGGYFPQLHAHAGGVIANLQVPSDAAGALCWGRRFAAADGASGAPLCGATRGARRLAPSNDGRLLAVAGIERGVHLVSLADGAVLATLPVEGVVNDLRFSTDGTRLAVAAGREVQVFDVAARALLVRLFDFFNGEWVALTPEGYFAASTGGAERVAIRQGGRRYALEQFFDVFYRPDVVQKKLAGEAIGTATNIVVAMAAPPPEVTLEHLPADGSGKLRFGYRVTGTGGGVGEVRVYQNGKLVAAEGGSAQAPGSATTLAAVAPGAAAGTAAGSVPGARAAGRARAATPGAPASAPTPAPSRESAQGTLALDPAPGANRIEVVAFNGANQIKSAPGVLDVSAQAAAPPRLVIAAFGIGQYASARAVLRFPAKDARDVARDLAAAARPLFGAVNIPLPVVLTDAAATRHGILDRLAAIGRDLRPQDVLVVFIASHGVMDDGEYAMLTHEFDGRLSDANSIGARELVLLARDAKALKQVWVFDTCHSGGIGRSLRGLMDAQVTVLARSAGLHMVAAASSAEQAKDGYRNNGLFTHAILKALKSADVDFNRDGRASALEFGEFSRDEATVIARQVGWNQTPLLLRQGRDFDVYRVPR